MKIKIIKAQKKYFKYIDKIYNKWSSTQINDYFNRF